MHWPFPLSTYPFYFQKLPEFYGGPFQAGCGSYAYRSSWWTRPMFNWWVIKLTQHEHGELDENQTTWNTICTWTQDYFREHFAFIASIEICRLQHIWKLLNFFKLTYKLSWNIGQVCCWPTSEPHVSFYLGSPWRWVYGCYRYSSEWWECGYRGNSGCGTSCGCRSCRPIWNVMWDPAHFRTNWRSHEKWAEQEGGGFQMAMYWHARLSIFMFKQLLGFKSIYHASCIICLLFGDDVTSTSHTSRSLYNKYVVFFC